MRKLNELTADDFPGADPQKFEEWKQAVQNANTYSIILLVGLVLFNVILYAATGSIMFGGLLLLLIFVLIQRKPGKLAKELGITPQKIKEARSR